MSIEKPSDYIFPHDAIDIFVYKGFTAYVAQNPFQYAKGNEPTYRGFARRETDTIRMGHVKFERFYFAGDVVKALIQEIDKRPPLASREVPVPDYRGYTLSVAQLGEKQYIGSATFENLKFFSTGDEAQLVINDLRVKVDRYVALGFGPKYEESP